MIHITRKLLIQLLRLPVIIFVFISCSNKNNEHKNKSFQRQLGSYILDTTKTNLANYQDNYELYKNLTITFISDSTFHLNLKVPFIYDSIGKWKPSEGGVEDWNWLSYKSNPNINTQFTEPWTTDSIFYMNSVTPQVGQIAVSKIYFKKIK